MGEGGKGPGRVVAVVNQKGGVGKTTVSLNLAACLAEAGARVLAVDLDPQGHLGLGLGVDALASRASLGQVLLGEAPLAEAIQATRWERLWLAPAEAPSLEEAGRALAGRLEGEGALAQALAAVDHDWVVVDCRPTLDLLALNALLACDLILVPVNPSRYSLEGLAELLAGLEDHAAWQAEPVWRVHPARGNGCQSTRRLRVVLNRHDSRARATNRWAEEELRPYRHLVLATVLRQSEQVNQAAIAQAPVIAWARRGAGARDFRRLAGEVERACPR